MANPKHYRIGFYRVTVGADARMGHVCDRLLAARDVTKMARALKMGENQVQIRGIEELPHGAGVKGYVARFRDETPLTGSPDTPIETPVQLDEGRALIERNHFILYRERADLELIAYQVGLEGTHIAGLGHYLTLLFGADDAVCMNQVLSPDAYRALATGGLIKSVDFRVAKPRSKRFAPDPEDTWTQEGFDFMKATGATSYEVKISTRKRGEGLLADVRERIGSLLRSPFTKKLRVKMSDIEEPIDLLAQRLKERITVLPVDGNITSAAVLDGIRGAKIRVQPQLDEIFGQGDEILE